LFEYNETANAPQSKRGTATRSLRLPRARRDPETDLDDAAATELHDSDATGDHARPLLTGGAT
jgi:hypothetical protein